MDNLNKKLWNSIIAAITTIHSFSLLTITHKRSFDLIRFLTITILEFRGSLKQKLSQNKNCLDSCIEIYG